MFSRKIQFAFLRLSLVLVAGICLGFYLTYTLLISNALPVRPFGNKSQPISSQPIVCDGRENAEMDPTAKNTSLLEGNGVIFTEHGGIGHQLFRYACSYALARDRKLPLYNLIPNSSSLSSEKFNQEESAFTLDKFQVSWTNVIHEGSIDTSAVTYINDSQLLFKTYPIDKTLLQFTGYGMQYYGFWAQYKKDIVDMFQLRPEVVQEFSSYVINFGNYIETVEESVAVHVRRGDFPWESMTIPISYQRDSIVKISNMLVQRWKTRGSSESETLTLPKFFIFSDDIEYCKRELSNLTEVHDLIFVSRSGTDIYTTSLEDFYLMMKCKHFIIPNSAFSWWAAFLGTHKGDGSSSNPDSIVIASTNGPGYWKKRHGTDPKNLNFYRNVIHGWSLFPNEWIVHTPAD